MTNHLTAVEKDCQLHWKFSCFHNQKRKDKNGGVRSPGDPTAKIRNLVSDLFPSSKGIKDPFLEAVCRRNVTMLQLGCYQLDIKKHMCCTRGGTAWSECLRVSPDAFNTFRNCRWVWSQQCLYFLCYPHCFNWEQARLGVSRVICKVEPVFL